MISVNVKFKQERPWTKMRENIKRLPEVLIKLHVNGHRLGACQSFWNLNNQMTDSPLPYHIPRIVKSLPPPPSLYIWSPAEKGTTIGRSLPLSNDRDYPQPHSPSPLPPPPPALPDAGECEWTAMAAQFVHDPSFHSDPFPFFFFNQRSFRFSGRK